MPILLAVSWQPEAQEKLQLFNRPAKVPDGTYSTLHGDSSVHHLLPGRCFIHYEVVKGQFKSYKVARGRAGQTTLFPGLKTKGQTHMGKLHSAISLPHPSPQNPKQGRREYRKAEG